MELIFLFLYMNDLKKYFDSNNKHLIHKWNHYFDIYDKHFSKFRGEKITLLEIGVSHGGSLQMWKDYFGENVKIYGVDINPQCKALEENQIEIFIGSQEDRKFLRNLKSLIPKIDILIDDGGHTMRQQIITFQELYSHVNINGGIYLCEDLHTSYWEEFGGGYKKFDSFIEYSKNFIDSINAWHSKEKHIFSVDDITKSTYSLHYYDSILVMEKKLITKPSHKQTGKKTLLNKSLL